MSSAVLQHPGKARVSTWYDELPPEPLAKYTKSERRLIGFLMERVTSKGDWQTYVNVTQETIAQAIGVTRRTVVSALRRLTLDGLIERRRQPRLKGGRFPDLIIVRRAWIAELKAFGFHIRTWAKRAADKARKARAFFHIRTTSVRVNGALLTTAPDKEQSGTVRSRTETPLIPDREHGEERKGDMQGELFAGNRSGKQAPRVEKDGPRLRLKQFQQAYRAKYGRPYVVPNLMLAYVGIKRMQQHLPTPEHWQAALRNYFVLSDPQITDAAHPLPWMPGRLPMLIRRIETEVAEDKRQAAIAAQNAAIAAQETDAVKRQRQYPGIKDGETVEQWKARKDESRAKRLSQRWGR